jgi:hypothetical protein
MPPYQAFAHFSGIVLSPGVSERKPKSNI